jgi:hypothetical protein
MVAVPIAEEAQMCRLIEFASDTAQLADQRQDLQLRAIVDDLHTDLHRLCLHAAAPVGSGARWRAGPRAGSFSPATLERAGSLEKTLVPEGRRASPRFLLRRRSSHRGRLRVKGHRIDHQLRGDEDD